MVSMSKSKSKKFAYSSRSASKKEKHCNEVKSSIRNMEVHAMDFTENSEDIEATERMDDIMEYSTTSSYSSTSPLFVPSALSSSGNNNNKKHRHHNGHHHRTHHHHEPSHHSAAEMSPLSSIHQHHPGTTTNNAGSIITTEKKSFQVVRGEKKEKGAVATDEIESLQELFLSLQNEQKTVDGLDSMKSRVSFPTNKGSSSTNQFHMKRNKWFSEKVLNIRDRFQI